MQISLLLYVSRDVTPLYLKNANSLHTMGPFPCVKWSKLHTHELHKVNPLSPNIQIQILQTGLYTFPLRISWDNLIKDQGIFS